MTIKFKWLNKILPQIVLVPMTYVILAMPIACAQNSEIVALRQIKLQARHIEDSGNLDQADALYSKALLEAERTGSRTDHIEILSRLVRLRINNHKIKEAEPLAQQAIQLVSKWKGKPEFDPEMAVWMDDMADAYYSHGEHVLDEKTKEYSLMRYLDIKLPSEDRSDPQFICKMNLFITHLYSLGRYTDALPYVEKQIDYCIGARHSDVAGIAFQYFELGNGYLGANDPAKAESAFLHSIQLHEQIPKDPIWDALMENHIAQAKMEENKLDDARAICKKALRTHNTYIFGPNEFSLWDEFVLGLIEQRAGNFKEAARYYRMSLDSYDKLPRPAAPNLLNPGGFDSRGVVCAEHLADMLEAIHTEIPSIRLLRTRAKKIRAQHPEWLVHAPNPEQHFAITGYLPFRVDIIPTHLPSLSTHY